jgi:hypothetical protein
MFYKTNGEQAREWAGADAKFFPDFRKILDLKDVDAVHIATPDHWHAIASVMACQAGKDVLCRETDIPDHSRRARDGERRAQAQSHRAGGYSASLGAALCQDRRGHPTRRHRAGEIRTRVELRESHAKTGSA